MVLPIIPAPSHIYLRPDVSSEEKAVLIALSAYCDEEGYCWPSRGTIASHTGFSERTVSRHLATLEEKGLITKQQRRYDDGAMSSNGYWVQWFRGLMPPKTPPAKNGSPPPAKNGTLSNTNLEEDNLLPSVVSSQQPTERERKRHWDKYQPLLQDILHDMSKVGGIMTILIRDAGGDLDAVAAAITHVANNLPMTQPGRKPMDTRIAFLKSQLTKEMGRRAARRNREAARANPDA